MTIESAARKDDTRSHGAENIFQGQLANLLVSLGAITLTYLVYFLLLHLSGIFLGVSNQVWFWIAIITPVVHQLLVAILWRFQLYRQSLTNWLGKGGFTLFGIVFSVLFFGRYILVIFLSIATQNSFTMDLWIRILLGFLLLVPFAFLAHALKTHFGFKRALGADHFFEEYRHLPMVKTGIYRVTSNAMYFFGFLPMWAVAVWLASLPGIAAALFNQLYIWAHYYFTEKPDMAYIYGEIGG